MWLPRTFGIAVSLVALAAGTAFGADSDTFSNEPLGFSVTKPSDWHFMAGEEPSKPESFEQLVNRHSKTPVVTITKHAEPFDDVNASLIVNTRPIGALADKPPVRILEMLTSAQTHLLPAVELAQKPEKTRVGGLDGAYMRMNYTQKLANGHSLPVTSEIWVLRAKRCLFIIKSGSRRDEQTGTRAELHEILDKMRFES